MPVPGPFADRVSRHHESAMNPGKKNSGPTFVVVTPEAARQNPYPYVYVNEDGTVRELRPDERSFLETSFTPGDGGRPATKDSYNSVNGWGSIRGFCRRDRIPGDIGIQPDQGGGGGS